MSKNTRSRKPYSSTRLTLWQRLRRSWTRWRAERLKKKQERERQLKAFAVIMNAQSGKMLDESTRLDSVTYDDEIMQISYTLTSASKNEVDSDEFAKNAKALIASAS